MNQLISTITRKGQVTLPAEVRRHSGLTDRDKVAFVLEEGGTVPVRPVEYPTIASLSGAAGTLPRPIPDKR